MTNNFTRGSMIVSQINIPTICQEIRPEDKEMLLAMGIDEHTYASALDPDELARIEFDDNYTAILCKIPRIHQPHKPFQFEVTSLGIFLFKGKTILISSEDLTEYSVLKIKSDFDLVLHIMSKSVVHFREHLRAINAISDQLQTEINFAMSNHHLISLFSLQKSLVYYIDSINSNGILLDRIKSHAAKMRLSEDDVETLEYNIIENAQCAKQAEIYSNILASLMDARASIIGNNLNLLMKTLNVITICIMVPTLVVSAFSMNVILPFAMSAHPLSFFFIIGLAIFAAFGFLWWWKAKQS